MPHFDRLKIEELRSRARKLNIPVDDIRLHGDLRHRQTWIDAIAATNPQPATESVGTTPVSGDVPHLETDAGQDESSTCGQNVHKLETAIAPLLTSDHFDQKLTVIQNDDEVDFVDGQLAFVIPLPQARIVANLVNTGNWAEAFQAVRGNDRATRILSRIREVLAA